MQNYKTSALFYKLGKILKCYTYFILLQFDKFSLFYNNYFLFVNEFILFFTLLIHLIVQNLFHILKNEHLTKN